MRALCCSLGAPRPSSPSGSPSCPRTSSTSHSRTWRAHVPQPVSHPPPGAPRRRTRAPNPGPTHVPESNALHFTQHGNTAEGNASLSSAPAHTLPGAPRSEGPPDVARRGARGPAGRAPQHPNLPAPRRAQRGRSERGSWPARTESPRKAKLARAGQRGSGAAGEGARRRRRRACARACVWGGDGGAATGAGAHRMRCRQFSASCT